MITELDKPTLELLEEHVRRLLATMGFEAATVHCRRIEEGAGAEVMTSLIFDIEAGDEGRLLIGVQGIHLAALQHVVRCLLRSQLSSAVQLAVDVNGYRAKRERNMAGVAEAAARRATMQGRTVVLKPMTAADRRLVHTTLAPRGDIKTESMGEEPNRRVVIKPVFL